jgi:chorismate dehydratase
VKCDYYYWSNQCHKLFVKTLVCLLLLKSNMDKIRISAVSYLNTKPFVYGLQHSDLIKQIDLSLDFPSQCAAKLSSDLADIGLIPVAAIPDVQNAQLISDFCIASSGKVQTVVLLSNVPLADIKRIDLDYQSRTSVQLVRILAKKFWEIAPQWGNGQPGYIECSKDITTAVVVIGDRVFETVERFTYCYDLGEEWKKFTGLDFVFACWIANKTIDIDFISEFNMALSYGLSHLTEVIYECENFYPGYHLNEYFRENISFVLDDSKRKGLDLFNRLNAEVNNNN